MRKRAVIAVTMAVALATAGLALAAQVHLDSGLQAYKSVSGVSAAAKAPRITAPSIRSPA